MSGINIKLWGCKQKSHNRKFRTDKSGKNVVDVTQEIECRYDVINPVNEDGSDDDGYKCLKYFDGDKGIEHGEASHNSVQEPSMQKLIEGWNRFIETSK